jgi:hypothetical protein
MRASAMWADSTSIEKRKIEDDEKRPATTRSRTFKGNGEKEYVHDQ